MLPSPAAKGTHPDGQRMSSVARLAGVQGGLPLIEYRLVGSK